MAFEFVTWPKMVVHPLRVHCYAAPVAQFCTAVDTSYPIPEDSDFDEVSMNVGFHYMANAGGRLAGTDLSGWAYQTHGLARCPWWSVGFVPAAVLPSCRLAGMGGSG